MPKLVLVKHSNSNHSPRQAPSDWELTAEGIARCQPLAARLAPHQPLRLFCSSMPKALQTAQHVSQSLGHLPIIQNPLLAEHSRQSNAPYGALEDFHARIQRLFAQPNQLVFGDETANQASARFHRGIQRVLEGAEPAENIAVIAHGTVNVLFTAQYNQLNPYDLWRRLKMPSIIVLDLPSFRLRQVIEDAGSP